MHVSLLLILNYKIIYVVFLGAAPNLQIPGLEICAVGARNQLPECVVAGEPGLQVVFLGSGVIQGPRDNIDNLIGESQCSHELLRSGDHLVVGLPGVFRSGEDELLYFLELVDSENAPGVLAMSACLLPEASGCACVFKGKGLLLDPFAPVQSRNGLFGCGDQVVVIVDLLRAFAFHLVQGLLEVAQLAGFSHDLSLHEEWWLDCSVAPLSQESQAVVDQRIVE